MFVGQYKILEVLLFMHLCFDESALVYFTKTVLERKCVWTVKVDNVGHEMASVQWGQL